MGRINITVDRELNTELEYILNSIQKTTGIRHSKPAAVRFLIQHYNASKDRVSIKRRGKKDLVFF